MRLPRSSSSDSKRSGGLARARRRPPGRPRSTWLRNVQVGAEELLNELDIDLLDARASAQNRPLWRIIAKHGATLP